MGVDQVDQWQCDLLGDLRNGETLVTACCSRGLGKSVLAAAAAVDHVLRYPGEAKVVIASVAQRGAQELLRSTKASLARIETPVFETENKSELAVGGAGSCRSRLPKERAGLAPPCSLSTRRRSYLPRARLC